MLDFISLFSEKTTRDELGIGSVRDAFAKNTSQPNCRQVREAFNSPFRPFVLATTSVGQEGLDFHPYCHAIIRWNLPSNPVDLEQREGRIHRYKGHAIRKNLAFKYGTSEMFTVWFLDKADRKICLATCLIVSLNPKPNKLFATFKSI